jgi:hypothetical protein
VRCVYICMEEYERGSAGSVEAAKTRAEASRGEWNCDRAKAPFASVAYTKRF